MHLIGQKTNTYVERLSSTIASTNIAHSHKRVEAKQHIANNSQLDYSSPFTSGLYLLCDIVHTIMVLFINVLVSKNLTL